MPDGVEGSRRGDHCVEDYGPHSDYTFLQERSIAFGMQVRCRCAPSYLLKHPGKTIVDTFGVLTVAAKIVQDNFVKGVFPKVI